MGQFQTISTHKFWGKPISVTDLNGWTTSYTYDNWGKQSSVRIPTAASTGYTLNYSDGWDIGSHQLYYTLVQDPSAPDVKTWYDVLGRPVQTKQESFKGAWTSTQTTYDAKGNVASSTNNYLPSETPITTTNRYDALNRIISSKNVFGTTSYAYSSGSGSATTTITLPDGKVKKTTTDAIGKILRSSNGIAGTIHYSYDSRGNEIKTAVGTETVPQNTLIQKEYDPLGQLKKMIDPDASTSTYNYNAFGQLIQETDPKGKTTSYEYDLLGRITSKVLDGYTTSYSYYDHTKGYQIQSMSVSSPEGSFSDDYDYAIGGGLTRHVKTVKGKKMEQQYTYDAYNRASTKEYVSSGFKTKNYYDANGFLLRISTNFTGIPSVEKTLYEAIAMNGNGQVTQFKRADGLPASYSYYNGIITHYLSR